MIRIFIEGQELDVNEGFTHQITYAIDDIQNIDSKATSFSKTIILPGTSNNNKLLGNIFEFGNSNFTQDGAPNVGYNFNASKSAKVLVEINGLIILKGALRLLEIIIDGQNIEYEIALFGELGGFVSKLGNQRLQDLDFSRYDHTYNANYIIASWEQNDINTSSILFDSTNKIITFAEAPFTLYPNDTFEIVGSTNNDGIYTVIKATIDWPNYNTLKVFVKESLINETSSSAYISLTNKGSGYYYPLIDYGRVSLEKDDFFYKAFRPALYVREYLDKIITGTGYTYESNFFNSAFFKRLIIPNNDNGFKNRDLTNYIEASTSSNQSESLTLTQFAFLGRWTIAEKIKKLVFTNTTLSNFTYNNGVYTFTGGNGTTTKLDINFGVTHNVGQYIYAQAFIKVKRNNSYIQSYQIQQNTTNIQVELNVDLNNNDTLSFDIVLFIQIPPFLDYTSSIQLTVLNQSDFISTTYPEGYVDYVLDDTIKINHGIPQNILQKDFFTSILKMFNLMVTEDKFKENHLIIEPWVDFYNLNSSTYIDWSDKLDRSEAIRIKPMSELNARYYEFKYKSDSDYYNEKYKKKFNEGYGDRKFDNQLEFAKETSTNEVIFSATPLLGYDSRDKIVPTILKWDGTTSGGSYVNEEQVGSNIRIMQVKKITGVTAWNILDGYPEATGPITNGANLTAYGYAGHLDDPDAPNVDLNFGATQELYFNLATGALSNNMFNAYYSPYMAEITDKDSRLFTAKFKLNENDIFNLDFGRFIWIDGILYRLIKIYDYSEGELCKVDLLRVIYTTY